MMGVKEKQNSSFYKGKCVGFFSDAAVVGTIRLAPDCAEGIKPLDVAHTWLAGYFPRRRRSELQLVCGSGPEAGTSGRWSQSKN